MFVYVLECSDRSYYTGVTNNVERRIAEHNCGMDAKSYTYNKRPVILKSCEEFEGSMQAIVLEKKLKGWSRKKKEALFRRDWEEISRLSKKK